jgi:hypothetical protein
LSIIATQLAPMKPQPFLLIKAHSDPFLTVSQSIFVRTPLCVYK